MSVAMNSVLQAIEGKQAEMLAFLEQLVNVDSGFDNPEGIALVARIIGRKLQDMHFGVKYLDYPNICTHLFARRQGAGSKEVMIIGHMDTIFPKGTVLSRPFKQCSDKAYGPGVLDMKGGITLALFALEAMFETGWDDKTVTVFLAGDEEIAHLQTNAVQLFKQYAQGKDAVFNMETSGGAVLVGRKGNIHPELIVKGVAAHAGADLEKGANAIVELAHKVMAIDRLTDFSRGLTFNIGVIKGGTVANAVADYASVKVDMRYLTGADGQEGVRRLRDIAAQTFIAGTSTEVINTNEKFAPMEATEANLRLYELVREQAGKLGLNIEKKIGGGSSDSGWTARTGAPTLCAMGAVGEFNHSDREYIFVNSLIERAKLLALSIDAV